MNIEEFRQYCLLKKGVTEEFPFDESTLVFKVMGKMFALTGIDKPEFSVNLKCEPSYAEELREKYSSIIPGYHMSKKHWNSVYPDHGDFSDDFFKQLIDDSYILVVSKLTKTLRNKLESL